MNIHLIYGSRKPDDIIFDKELQQLAGKHKNIKVDYVISEPPSGWKGATGLLDDWVISSLAGDLKGKTVFTCGPALMYELCGAALVKLGVPARRRKQGGLRSAARCYQRPGLAGYTGLKGVRSHRVEEWEEGQG